MPISTIRKVPFAALAVVLLLPAAAIADPVDAFRVSRHVRAGYQDVVHIQTDFGQGTGIKSLQFKSTKAGDVRDPLFVTVEGGNVSEGDITRLVTWLGALERRDETLERLIQYTNPPDPAAERAFLGAAGAVRVELGGHRAGYANRAGRGLAVIEGGDNASAGQVGDALQESLVSLAAEEARQSQTWTVSLAELDALSASLRQAPPGGAVPSAEEAAAFRKTLARDIAAGVADRVAAANSSAGPPLVSTAELTTELATSGTHVESLVDERRRLTVFRVEGAEREVVAADLPVYPGPVSGGSTLFLRAEAMLALSDQASEEFDMNEALTEEIGQADAETSATVEEILTEPEPEPERPGEPGDTPGEGENDPGK